MTEQETEDLAKKAVKNKNVKVLCKALFDVKLYPTQEEIVKDIAFQREKNVVINAYTRYGKTFAVGIGLALYLVLNGENLDDFRIGIVGPTDGDAQGLRKEMLKAGIKSDLFKEMLDMSRGSDPEDMLKSRNKDSLTLRDGAIEIHNVSASSGKSGDGSGAMGEGFDLIVCAPYDAKLVTDQGVKKIGEVVENKEECRVLSYNHDKEKAEFKEITNWFENGVRDIFEVEAGEKKMRCTGNHPVYIEGKGYTAASEIEKGDVVMGLGFDLNVFDTNFNYGTGMRSLQQNTPDNHAKKKGSRQRFLRSGLLQPVQKPRHDRMQSMRKGILSPAFACSTQRRTGTNLQQRMLWQGILGENEFKENGGMRQLQQENRTTSFQNQQGRKNFLFQQMQRQVFQRGEQSTLERISRNRMRDVRRQNKGKAFNGRKQAFLQQGMSQQMAITNDDGRRQLRLERRNRKRTLPLEIQRQIKEQNKGDAQFPLLSMRRKEGLTESSGSPHRLRQEKYLGGKSCSSLLSMPSKDKLQQRLLERVTVESIRKVESETVYNIEVADNNNYFLDGVLTHNCDESNRISHSFWKESGDRLREHEDSVLIEMGNPFHKDNQFYRHYTRNDFKVYHVGEEKGLKEGRHSKEWFDNRAKEVGGRQSLEYKVLYKSEFPDQVDDALIAHSWLERAEKNSFEFEDPDIIYSIDVAGTGEDKLVVSRVEKESGRYRLTDQWARDKSSDTGETAHWADKKVSEERGDVDRFVVDAVGIGAGVHSKLQELGFNAVKFKAGEKPKSEGDRFQNKKARNFFKLRDVLQENDLELCDNYAGRGNQLVHELTHIKTERRARDKIKIVDPDSGSPDYGDALMMCFYEGSTAFVM